MPEVRLRGGDVDGLRLHYVVEGQGPAVILIHGLGGFAESWRHNTPALARRARVWALDLPGFGRSAKPRGRYRLADFASAVHGFMDALEIPRATLVGHSLGGAVSAASALAYPARVAGLGLVGAVVPGLGYRPPWVARLVSLPGVGEVLGLAGSARLYKALLARCFHAPVRAEVDFFVEHAYEVRAGPAARAAYLATLRHLRADFEGQADAYRRALAALDVPTLVVHGRQDRVVPPGHAAAIAAVLPRAVLQWVDACGHFPQIEQPDHVNGLLTGFLAGRPAPRGTEMA